MTGNENPRIRMLEVKCPETGWPLKVHVEPRTDLPEEILPGASLPPKDLGDGRWRLHRYCPFCHKFHDFDTALDPPPQSPEDRPPKPSIEPGIEPGIFKQLDSGPQSVFSPTPEIRVTLEGLERVMDRYLPTPADGAAAYQAGALKVRTGEKRELEKALILLRRAKEIYLDNKRPRDAAYAATVMAEALEQLERPEEALAELEFAQPKLIEQDRHMRARAEKLRQRLAG